MLSDIDFAMDKSRLDIITKFKMLPTNALKLDMNHNQDASSLPSTMTSATRYILLFSSIQVAINNIPIYFLVGGYSQPR